MMQTLRLQFPLGKTIVLAFALILLAGLCLEGLAHVDPLTASLAPPSVGSQEEFVGMKVERLDRWVQSGGEIDCIFLGSSMVHAAFEPESFGAAYERETRTPLTCFNLGLLGAGMQDIGLWAEVVTERYHPRVLIIGVSPREMSPTNSAQQQGTPLDIPWARYQLGEPTLEGWLADHSRAYRYWLEYRLWTVVDYHARIDRQRRFNREMTPFGFLPDDHVTDVTVPPDFETDRLQQRIRVSLAAYEVGGLQREALASTVSLRPRNPMTMIVVEMPLPEMNRIYFDDPDSAQQQFRDAVSAEAGAQQVPVIAAPPSDLFAADCWADYFHTNTRGAIQYSRWLGGAIGRAVEDREIRLPGE